VTLHDRAGGRGVIAPDADSLVARAGSDQRASVIDSDISDGALVTSKFIGAGVGSQSPGEDDPIVGTGDNLLEAGMENCLCDSIFVSLE
jgi:hypothetical protein